MKEKAMSETVCVILAAGKGKRMQDGEVSKQKVLVEIEAKPMLGHVLETVASVGIQRIVVVVGHQGEQVEKYLEQWKGRLQVDTVQQKELLGTADAVRRTEPILSDYAGDVLILYGDTPFLTQKTLEQLLAVHKTQKNYCTLLTTLLQDPSGYGRIVRNGTSDTVSKIVEDVDATPEERSVQEINVGVYCFQSKILFEALKEVKPNNRKHEYYLTDTVTILSNKQKSVRSLISRDRCEVLGVNSPQDLERAKQQRHDQGGRFESTS